MLFQSTPSARRATPQGRTCNLPCRISIHALREEGDVKPPVCSTAAFYFNPRPPRGGRRARQAPASDRRKISIHALREEGDLSIVQLPTPSVMISIHALREEGDCCCICMANSCCIFQSTPSARRATQASNGGRCCIRFQSTPSARRATVILYPPFLQVVNFNPRPPRGGRLYELLCIYIDVMISIHALREEGDALVLPAISKAF